MSQFLITKVNAPERIVYGWAGQYIDSDGKPLEDLQGDIIDPVVVEKASYNFLLKSRESGIMHEGHSVGNIVASLVTTPEIVKAFFGEDVKVPVGWIIGVKYESDKIFKRVLDGELTMFSIQGRADAVEED